MYYAQNISTGEFWYFTSIQKIAEYLEASLDDVNMVLERNAKSCNGWIVTKVNINEDPIIGAYVWA